MKRIRNSLFFKTFCVSLLMLVLITATAYLLLYLFLPVFYENHKMSEYDEKAQVLMDSLENASDEKEELDLLGDFAKSDTANVTVYKSDGDIFFQITESIEMSVVQDAEDVVGGNSFEMTTDAAADSRQDYIESEYSYNANGRQRSMIISIPLQPLDEAKVVIISIYPLAGLLCVVFSLILAVLFSRTVVRPVRNIRNTLRDMASLKPGAYIHINSHDEIAEMSHDINCLYQELHSTISDLEQKIQDCSAQENQKIDFLRNVSHELKTPLASANALIEGIIYDVPPYCDDRERYLAECRDFLQKAITLTKESLSLSPVYKDDPKPVDLKQLVESEFHPYKVILKSRQIRYSVDIPENIMFTTSHNLFAKAISNVLSNAANYTASDGYVRIRYEDNCLHIENTCTPLSADEMQAVMKPLYSGNHGNKNSNGLGLYIVKQSLSLLKIPFDFKPIEDDTGMRFTFCFQDGMIVDKESISE